jgi:Fe-S oxidoreductase
MALEDYRAVAERDNRCSYCKWIPFDHVKSWRYAKGCPSSEYGKFHAYSAGGRLSVILSLLEKRIDYTDDILDIAYKCQTCGSCDISCKVCLYTLWPLDAILELRAKLVEDGQLLPQHKPVIDSLRKEDNMMLKPKAERGKWAEGLKVKNVTKEKAEVLFHAGCRMSFDEELQKVARTAVTLLKNAGVDIAIMGKDELCCGGRAYSMGYREEFTRCAKKNIESWSKASVKTIVTSCADCYHAFKRLYPTVGSKFQVFHTVEYLDKLIKEGKIKFSKNIPLKVTYHDPCHLGRQGEPYIPWDGKEKKIYSQMVIYEPRRPRYNGAKGIYIPPRNILQSIPGINLVEMERIKEYAWCCGAGGGVRETYPDFSSSTAAERIDEAKSTGAEAIVTACPWCERNFIDAVAVMHGNMKVFDIVELVQQALR